MAILNMMVYQDIQTLDPKITEMTGHTLTDVLKGMQEETAIMTLVNFMHETDSPGFYLPIVGQNALFDYTFLVHALDRWNIDEMQTNDLYDTLTIGRDRKPYPHKLADLCRHYNVEQENWHSAYYDALATGYLFLAMHEEDKSLPKSALQVADYKNVIGYKRQYGEPVWCPEWVTLKPQGNVSVDENRKGEGTSE